MGRRLARVFLLLLFLVAACAPASSPVERLPTRAVTPVPTPFSIAAEAYYREGLARQAAGDAAGAVESFSRAIQLAPEFAPAYLARGSAYLAQGEVRRALADLDVAVALDPDNPAVHVQRGETLRVRGRPRSALEAFDLALALDPTLREDTFRSRWLSALAAGADERLLPLSDEYDATHPEDIRRYYYRGWAYAERGAPRVAISRLVRVIESTSRPPAVLWFALGHAYARYRSWPEAVVSFEAVLKLVREGDTSLAMHSDQPIPELFTALGEAYLEAGRCSDAEAMLAYAMEVGQESLELESMLRRARVCQTPTPEPTPYPTTTPPAP